MELSDDERIGLVGFLSEHVNKKQLEMVEHKAWNCLKDDADHKILKGIRKLVFVRMDSPESMSQSNFNTLINRRLGIPPGQQQQQGGSANTANSSTPNHAGSASGGGGGSRGGPAQGANHSGAVNGSPNPASGGSGGGGGSGSGQASARGASRVGASNGSPSPAGGGSRSRGGDSAQAPIHVSAVELEDTDNEEEGDTVSEHDQNDDNGGDSDGGDTDLEDTPAAKYEEHKSGFLQRRRWKVKEFEPPGEPPGNGYWVDTSSEDDGIVLLRMPKPGDLERAKPRPSPTYITNNPYCTDAPKASFVKRLTMYGLLKVVAVSSQGGIWRAPDAEIERVLRKDPRVPPDISAMPGDAYVKVMGETFRRHQEERDEIQREAEEESEDEVAAPQGKRSRVDINS